MQLAFQETERQDPVASCEQIRNVTKVSKCCNPRKQSENLFPLQNLNCDYSEGITE